MTIGSLIRARPIPVLHGLTIASLVALLPLPPLLQNQAYHQFADQRELLGIPNFWNVVSNLLFVVVGAVGLLRFHRDATTTVLFAGIFLTGFGSSYYHLDPNDSTLFWDRLPMTICFAQALRNPYSYATSTGPGRGLYSYFLRGIKDLLPARYRT